MQLNHTFCVIMTKGSIIRIACHEHDSAVILLGCLNTRMLKSLVLWLIQFVKPEIKMYCVRLGIALKTARYADYRVYL